MPKIPSIDPDDRDDRPLTPAEDNPWYKLATLAGEQRKGQFDEDLHTQNRDLWNYWAINSLFSASRQNLASKKMINEAEITEINIDKFHSYLVLRGIENLPPKIQTIDFSNTEFKSKIRFDGFVFPDSVDFSGAHFNSGLSITRAKFLHYTKFIECIFREHISFIESDFFRVIDFSYSLFDCISDFEKVKFHDLTRFEEAIFKEDTYFLDIYSYNKIDFSRKLSQKWLSFDQAVFERLSVFLDSKFEGSTSFLDSHFKNVVPIFFGATLHEGIDFHGVRWPAVSTEPEEARQQARAYERLKLEMDRLNRHGEELDFFARELEAKSRVPPLGLSLGIRAYGFFSDYGRSIRRPALTLAALWFFIGAIYTGISGMVFPGPTLSITGWFGFSLASLFGLSGIRREFYPSVLSDQHVHWLVPVLSGVQSVLGAILVFLLLLAVRNRFRIK